MLGAAAAEAHESGGGSGGSSEVGAAADGGGNRWPRQETVALLRIRSEMDVAFRDSSVKGPLWEEVSRKLAELGFQRSAKKCKEKFENVYKYHKRTKDGRASKSDGKTYRFFDQLAALENTPPPPPFTTTTMAAPPIPSNPTNSPMPPSISSPNPIISNPPQTQPQNFQPQTYLTSSSTSSDEDVQKRRGRKRKWRDFFERITRDVIRKQEELHIQFMNALERRERDRLAREDAWRAQETTRANREHELLAHERSISAARDAALIGFLQKITDKQQNSQIPTFSNNNNYSAPPPIVMPVTNKVPENPPPQPQPQPPVAAATPIFKIPDDNSNHGSSSRWPKEEIEALIELRTSLGRKYEENGPKGPLWEEISIGMGRIGYNRSSKRCKEKWENINKYYKKVKESNKKRPEDSKTCPYFQQLDAIYKERANSIGPIMALPEQQWPVLLHDDQQHKEVDQNRDNEDNDEDDDNDEGGPNTAE